MASHLTLTFTIFIIIFGQSKLGCFTLSADLMEQSSFLINQLKIRVLPYLPPTSVINQYRNDDLYWMKWLKANSFNVTIASEHFLQNLKWREDYKMDTIHLEDWSYFQAEYPAFQGSFDRMGRPILEIWFSEWNIREAVMSGRTRQVIRWLIYNLEMEMRSLFETRANGNVNVTGTIQIIDYSGLSLITQGCARCIPIYTTFQNTGPLHYPGVSQEIYMLNLAQGFKVVISLWRQNLSVEEKNVLKVYGRELEWMRKLQSIISKDQLSTRFGGTLDRRVQ